MGDNVEVTLTNFLNLRFSVKTFKSFIKRFKILLKCLQYPINFPSYQKEFFTFLYDYLYENTEQKTFSEIDIRLFFFVDYINLVIYDENFIIQVYFNFENNVVNNVYIRLDSRNKFRSKPNNIFFENVTKFVHRFDPQNKLFKSLNIPIWYAEINPLSVSIDYFNNLFVKYGFEYICTPSDDIKCLWTKVSWCDSENKKDLYCINLNVDGTFTVCTPSDRYSKCLLSEVLKYVKAA